MSPLETDNMWTRKQYEDAAQQIGNTHTSSGGTQSINDLALKVAQDNGLNPEGIRTVVRLANVAVFENMFSKAAADKAPDRMFDFVVGDPEQVISQLGSTAKVACATPEVSKRSYDRTSDYYGNLETRGQEKVASEVVHVGVERSVARPLNPLESQAMFKRAEEIMTEQRRQAETTWYTSLEKAAQLTRVYAETPAEREAFEKSAVALMGSDVVPELRMIRSLTGAPIQNDLLDNTDKIAHVQEFHMARVSEKMAGAMRAIKEASEARALAHRYEEAALWAQKQRGSR